MDKKLRTVLLEFELRCNFMPSKFFAQSCAGVFVCSQGQIDGTDGGEAILSNLLEALITSKTRLRLLLKFFLNPNTSTYLRGLAEEFGESTNSIRLELNRLEQANMLVGESVGNKKLFKVNQQHPLFAELVQIVRKYVGLDVLIESIVRNLGQLKVLYLTGDWAKGKEAPIIDLVMVGDIDRAYLTQLISKAEELVERKIRYVVYSEQEAAALVMNEEEFLLIWSE